MKSPLGEASPLHPAGNLRSLRILCAEDDPNLAAILKFGLEAAGYFVEFAANGEAALARAMADPKFFGLVLTDNQMPLLSGLQLVEKLRSAAFPGKIIVHSSRLSEREVEAFRALSVDHIFSKPIRFDEMLGTIQRLEALP